MSEQTYRRRIVVVDRKFQLGMSGRIVMYLAAYFAFFFMLAVFAPFLGSVLEGATHEQTAVALSDLVRFSQRMLVPLLLTFVCLALHTILLTHRIAGPVYRFRKMFEGMRDGEISRDVTLRKGDFLTDLVEVYNVSIGKLRCDLDDLRTEVEGLMTDGQDGEATLNVRSAKMLRILDHYHTGREEAEAASESEPVAEEAESVGQ